MPTAKALTPDNSKFTFAVTPEISAAAEGAARKFTGLAYSGKPITGHYYWGSVVFDMSTMTVPPKLPALIDHDRGQRAGYVTSFSVTDGAGFTVTGNLLTNESGSSVSKDSDEGFPWQMSIHIEPGSTEEVQPGNSVVVNGQTLAGPITVFRNSVVKEVSFTATGYDSNTTATAFTRPSGNDNPPSTSTGDATMTTEQIAALQADNARLMSEKATADAATAEANAKLKKFAADTRTAAIVTLFADTKREYKADAPEVLTFSAMDQAAFDMTAKMLRDAAPKAPEQQAPAANLGLFSHQAGQGAEQGTNTTGAAPVNPLLADAQERAKKFASTVQRY